ncbi:MAG: hypothetical protein QM764_20770 [Chitinophagaceae bacterium]
MFFDLFKRNNNVTLQQFIESLRKGERNFFKALRIDDADFEEASFEELLSNNDDVLAGVNRVQKHFRIVFFDLFDGSLVKYYDNGDVKLVFFTTTRDTKKILTMASLFFDTLGHGFFDDRKFYPFNNKDRVFAIARAAYSDGGRDLLHGWSENDLTFLLQYRDDPFQQFSLMVTTHPAKQEDVSIRKKGTVLDMLKFDIHALLMTEAINVYEEKQDNETRFIDYTFHLPLKEMGAFDMIKVRIFGPVKEFDKFIQTHVTLFYTKIIPYAKKVSIAKDLIGLYGPDDSGAEDLQAYELELLENADYWTGRTWWFNRAHGLFKSGNPVEKMSYQVCLSDTHAAEGFNLHILFFNELVSQFGIS